MTEEEAFAMLAKGRKCTECGDPEVVMISMPKGPGEPFDLDEVGEKCWCRKCALLRFTTPKGKA